VPDAGPSDQRPAEHPARWHTFSAPTRSTAGISADDGIGMVAAAAYPSGKCRKRPPCPA
jgi:hypothetical protein